jgi:predicted secreted protein
MKGNDLIVSIGGTAVGFAQSASIDFSVETIEQNTKDNAGQFTSKRSGRKSVSVSTNGLLDYTDAGQGSIIDAIFASDSAVTLTWGTTTGTGNENYSGSFIVTSVSLNADENVDATYSATFESAGQVEQNVVA